MDRVNMVPGFILKLWKMINDAQCDDLISWSENGQSFIIMDPPKFTNELSKYFKHNNLSSFIRQLNMYGFRKVATIENSGLHPGTDDLHFYHPDFLRDKPERLEGIKRKLPQKIAESVDLRNVIKDISEIEDKQKDVTKTLSEIKRENEMLWAELHDLRQKHQQQQLYISRLMKLVFEAMEQNGIKTNMLQVKRHSPLMIEGGEDSSHIVKKTKLSHADDANALQLAAEEICGVQLGLEDEIGSCTGPSDEQGLAQEDAEQQQQQQQQQQEQSGLGQLPIDDFNAVLVPSEDGSAVLVTPDGVNTVYQTAPTTSYQIPTTIQPSIETPSYEVQDPASVASGEPVIQQNVETPVYHHIKDTINFTGDQIDDLVPSFIFSAEEINDVNSEINERRELIDNFSNEEIDNYFSK